MAGPSLQSKRSGYTAVQLGNGRILLLGGYLDADYVAACAHYVGAVCDGPPTRTAEIYDPVQGSFSPAGKMTVARAAPSAVRLQDGRVLVVGGVGDAGNVAPAEVYDPATGSFTNLGAFGPGTWTNPVHTLTNQSLTVLRDGRVLIAGGKNAGWESSNAAAIFDPATNQFADLPSMPVSWDQPTATLLPNGQVLLTSGYDNSLNYPAPEALLFDPAAGPGTFTTAGRVIYLRTHATLVTLPSGRVLIAGNSFGISENVGVEVFDPVTRTCSPVGTNMLPAAQWVMALPDGRVLVIGGANSGKLVAAAYDPISDSFSPVSSFAWPKELGAAYVYGAFPLADGSVALMTYQVDGRRSAVYRLTIE